MTRRPYERARIVATRTLTPKHCGELEGSAIDITTAGLAGVGAISHEAAYDFGIRADGDLGGLGFRYWEPEAQTFSRRYIRVKPDVQVAGRKYLQPVGETPRLYFVAGTTTAELQEADRPLMLTEGEKKTLALDRACRELSIPAVVVGIGGVWSWRHKVRELKPNGLLGKGESRSIPDLDSIRWFGRNVYLFFDTDVLTNWKVAAAETALARELDRRGANVHLVRLPGEKLWARLA